MWNVLLSAPGKQAMNPLRKCSSPSPASLKACDQLRTRINALRPKLEAVRSKLPATTPGTYSVTFVAPEVGISTAVFDGKVVVLCVNGGPESVQVVPSVYVSRVWGG